MQLDSIYKNLPPRVGQQVRTDTWPWGCERIVWGYDPAHKYTFKILEPKRGREGCLSLQYHHDKSESWFCLRGLAWILVVAEGEVCTRIMRPGDIQNLSAGTIHRLMGVSEDLQVIEPSTLDAHAASPDVAKDVVRLHCVLGRESAAPRNADEEKIVARSIELTESAIKQIESGRIPDEVNSRFLVQHGALII